MKKRRDHWTWTRTRSVTSQAGSGSLSCGTPSWRSGRRSFHHPPCSLSVSLSSSRDSLSLDFYPPAAEQDRTGPEPRRVSGRYLNRKKKKVGSEFLWLVFLCLCTRSENLACLWCVRVSVTLVSLQHPFHRVSLCAREGSGEGARRAGCCDL